MAITLTDGIDTVLLDADLYWPDENSWHPVEQTVQRSITGALLVSVSARVKGRPITLQPEDESSAWMLHSDLAMLKAWAAIPGQILSLQLRGVYYDVMFRHQDTALEAVPVVHYSDVSDGDYYRITLRFLEV